MAASGRLQDGEGGTSARRVPVAVVNGTGYGGMELLRLLLSHPVFEVVEVTARSEVGKAVASVFPQAPAARERGLVFGERVERAELVFVALPDHAAVELIPQLLAEGRRVVDLSAGFRLRDAGLYPRWYGYEHPARALLDEAIFGLPELMDEATRARLPDARLIACPGCYVTTALLALTPALRAGLIEPDVIVDGVSGTSGAGRGLRLSLHFSEAADDVSAYSVGGHRHQPEMAQELQRWSEKPVRLTFTPHLAPMARGILATCYATLRAGATQARVDAVYRAAYAEAPFVEVAETAPHTKWTLGSNMCYTHAVVDEGAGRLIAIGALDNLVKGAAGQAAQCANLLYQLDETLGLPRASVYP